ncbi:MAG: LCP family protein, partial [Thermoleophilaceae bacterium]
MAPWKRLLLGSLLIVAASASTTAYAAISEVDKVVAALGTAPALDLGASLAEADTGTPQTLMLIGSDKRAASSEDVRSGLSAGQRSDTIILARLDPARQAIALMSLPRDLKVDVPGHGTEKLNEAYALGGPKLSLETVKQLTGLRINHVINVDFSGFKQAVNAIGCVYVDIDRRYFNDNTGPMRYATIDVPQGYQKL